MRRQFRSSSKRAIFPETDVHDLCRKTESRSLRQVQVYEITDPSRLSRRPFTSVVESADLRKLYLASCFFAWERLGKEVRLLNSTLNRTESTGRLIRYVLITRRSLVQIQPLQPSPHDYSSPSPLGLITRIGRS